MLDHVWSLVNGPVLAFDAGRLPGGAAFAADLLGALQLDARSLMLLDVVADIYIKLIQMTVLPFVTVSIIGGLGSLTVAQARALARHVGIVLLLLWALTLGMVFLFPLMFPPHVGASFFSTTLVQEREPFDFVNLYIPTNPFNSLANNIVPAVVLFSIIVGTALMTTREKGRLLEVLDVISSAVLKATHFVVSLTPYGVFAIAAVVAGTLSIEDLERLEVYFVSYAAMALLTSFWIVPFYQRTFGWTPDKFGYIQGLVYLLLAPLSLLFGGWLAEYWSRQGRADAAMRVVFYASLLHIPFAVSFGLVPNPYVALALLSASSCIILMGAGPQNGAFQSIVPNEMRAQVTASFLFVFTVMQAAGPFIVGWLTDNVFGDPKSLRYALALIHGVTAPLAVLVFWIGLKPYGEAVIRARAWQN